MQFKASSCPPETLSDEDIGANTKGGNIMTRSPRLLPRLWAWARPRAGLGDDRADCSRIV